MIRSVRSGINLMQPDDSSATIYRFRGFARQLQAWFEPEGSPPFAQFIQNRRRWPMAASFRRLPRRGQSFMQGATFLVREVVAFIIHDEVDDRPITQSRRLVEYDASVLNACS
jgi:hypothetical protein